MAQRNKQWRERARHAHAMLHPPIVVARKRLSSAGVVGNHENRANLIGAALPTEEKELFAGGLICIFRQCQFVVADSSVLCLQRALRRTHI